jgi:hypothetical protein
MPKNATEKKAMKAALKFKPPSPFLLDHRLVVPQNSRYSMQD